MRNFPGLAGKRRSDIPNGLSGILASPPSKLKNLFALLAVLTLSACASHAPASRALSQDRDDRILYEIQLNAPGTRSQGWRGILYDPQGAPLQVQAGASVDTNVGAFVSIECRRPWDVCGMVHQDTLNWMHDHNANVILGRDPWSYRVIVSAECTRSEAWRGELIRAGQTISPAADNALTPMGPFVATTSGNSFRQHGWFPYSWPAPDPGAGHWPCVDREQAAADEPRVVFHASGVDPAFTLDIFDSDLIRLVWNSGRDHADFAKPSPILPAWNGEIYEIDTSAHRLRIEIRHLPCQNTAQAELLTDSVTVTINGRQMHGCGAPPLER